MRVLVPLFIGIILGPQAYGTEVNPALYPYHLMEVHHAVTGVIGLDTARGERVRAVLPEPLSEEHEGPVHEAFIQLAHIQNYRAKALLSTKNVHVFMTTEKPTTMTHEANKGKASTHFIPAQPTSAVEKAFTQDSSETPDNTMPTQGLVQHSSVNPDLSIPTQALAQDLSDNVDLTVSTGGTHPTTGHAIHLTHLHHYRNPLGHHINIHKRAAPIQELTYSVEDTSAFYIDPLDNFLKVNETWDLKESKDIPFYVVLTDEVGRIVSNPVPLTVIIERPEADNSYPLGPAVFAGVLVLIIVFLALFIPFVTRAKRRYKQGKPVFKMGTHPSTMDLEQVATMSRASSEPNWYGNNAYYTYEEEVEKERQDFSSGIKDFSSNAPPMPAGNKDYPNAPTSPAGKTGYSSPTRSTGTKDYSNAPTLQLTKKKNKETSSVVSSSSGIDTSSQSQFAEGTIHDEAPSERL